MNVYPRKPLRAERSHRSVEWPWALYGDINFSDAEFAAHFYPAERLDTLIAAVEAVVRAIPDNTSNADARHRLAAAFRAFREQVPA